VSSRSSWTRLPRIRRRRRCLALWRSARWLTERWMAARIGVLAPPCDDLNPAAALIPARGWECHRFRRTPRR
jgi:hypothetical protein